MLFAINYLKKPNPKPNFHSINDHLIKSITQKKRYCCGNVWVQLNKSPIQN